MSTVTQLPGWKMRVYRVAARRAITMGDATHFCRDNGVMPYPELMLKINPDIICKKK